jgi:hypothetical protein
MIKIGFEKLINFGFVPRCVFGLPPFRPIFDTFFHLENLLVNAEQALCRSVNAGRIEEFRRLRAKYPKTQKGSVLGDERSLEVWGVKFGARLKKPLFYSFYHVTVQLLWRWTS